MKYKKTTLFILVVMIASIVLMSRYAIRDVARNLQEALIENASLRRTVVELEEKQKIYSEVFECTEIRRRLGL